MKQVLIAIGLLLTFSGAATAEVQDREVTYRAGDTELKGYLAYDEAAEGKRPGILVVHEWWGHNEYARKRARMLANLGFTALALDMYGEGAQATHPKEAGEMAAQVRENFDVAKRRFTAALDLLRKHQTVDADKMGAIGFCFGGGVALEMARAGVDLDGVVSFHGTLGASKPAEPGRIKAKLLILQGGADPFVPAEQLQQFRQDMDAAGADYAVIVYPNAKHAFTNPEASKYGKQFNLPLEYNAYAARGSWADMIVFFNDVFR